MLRWQKTHLLCQIPEIARYARTFIQSENNDRPLKIMAVDATEHNWRNSSWPLIDCSVLTIYSWTLFSVFSKFHSCVLYNVISEISLCRSGEEVLIWTCYSPSLLPLPDLFYIVIFKYANVTWTLIKHHQIFIV